MTGGFFGRRLVAALMCMRWRTGLTQGWCDGLVASPWSWSISPVLLCAVDLLGDVLRPQFRVFVLEAAHHLDASCIIQHH